MQCLARFFSSTRSLSPYNFSSDTRRYFSIVAAARSSSSASTATFSTSWDFPSSSLA
jgi:hypothetical protein